MKNIYRFTLLTFFLTLLNSTQAQSMLTGNWKVCCLFEIMNDSSTKVCNLCPTIKRQQGVTIQGFDMKVGRDSVNLVMNDVTKSVKYTWSEESKEFEFTYEEVHYKFKVFLTCSNSYVLRNKDGQLLLLEEKINTK